MTSSIPINCPGSLKPGRIGRTQALVDRGALKPGRIGLRLRKLPGWELATTGTGTESLWRTFHFLRTETAQAFAAFAARAADEHGQRPVISQVWNRVTVTLSGAGGLSDAALDFAEVLMLLPGDGSGGAGSTEPQPQDPGMETPGTEVPGEVPGPIAQPTPTQPAPATPGGVEAAPFVQPFSVG